MLKYRVEFYQRKAVPHMKDDIIDIKTDDNSSDNGEMYREFGTAFENTDNNRKANGSRKEADDGNLFSSVPDSDEINRLSPIALDDIDEELIEKEAIASLPEAPSLDLLLYDSEGAPEKNDDGEEAVDYDSFLNDYKQTIARTLHAAKADSQDENEEVADDEEEEEAPKLVKHKEIDLSEDEEITDVEEMHTEEGAVNTDVIDEIDALFAIELTEEQKKDTPDSTDDSQENVSNNGTETNEEGEQLELDLGVKQEESYEDETDEYSIVEKEEEESVEEIPAKTRRLHSFFEIVELFVFTLAAVMILTNFVFRHSEVDGGSMMKTLHDGDHLIISDLFYTPDYGDIVVFSSDKTDGKALVKRIVALEGDEVDFYFAEGRYLLFVNNKLIEEDYAYIGGEGHVLSEVENYVVKKGEVFVLGDHRNDSHDSRSFGAIDVDSILGRVVIRIYPFSDFGTVD